MVESLCTWDCCAILRIRRIPSISMWDTVRTRNLCWIGSRCTMLGARGHWSTGTTTNVFLWESIRISICWDICRRIRSLHSRRWNTRVRGLWCWHARSGWPHSWNVSSRICGRPILVNKIIKQIRATISNQDRKWKCKILSISYLLDDLHLASAISPQKLLAPIWCCAPPQLRSRFWFWSVYQVLLLTVSQLPVTNIVV